MLIVRGFVDATLVVRGMTSSFCPEFIYKEIVRLTSKAKLSVTLKGTLLDENGTCLFKRKYKKRNKIL